MNRTEFNALGEYCTGLWPKLTLTPEQNELWWHALQHTDIFTAREAIGRAFIDCLWKEPTLAKIRDAIRDMKRATPASDPDFTPELLAQVKREAAEEAALVADWTPEEFSLGKAEVIAHEPGMAVFEGMAANGRFWTHILAERYVHHRAMAYPGKIKAIHRDRQSSEILLPRAIEIDRDEYWKAGPQPRSTGIRSVSNGNQERQVAQAAKVALIQENL